MPDPEVNNELASRWFIHKSQLMEGTLGREHEFVSHALLPYSLGGALDLYYYPNGLPGTAIATKELSPLPYEGPSNDVFRSYELVMFTRQKLRPQKTVEASSPSNQLTSHFSSILNLIASNCATTTFNPNNTATAPIDDAGSLACLIFDAYACHTDELAWDFGLLAVIEIFPSEMEFARMGNGARLLERMKVSGHYPYSDLNRSPVA